ncbi:MAG: 5-(carboxyamino)imidazole ribonucleotide mutase [Brevinematales bacterium]|nr:5-(carboxyamino)imidazole ribonucleotide mutase [Brevinematales bacterium]
MAKVLVIMGSDSDLPVLSGGLEIFKDFGVDTEVHFSSAHRSPERTVELVKGFEANGGRVILAAAGMSAHLAGVIAGHTVLPVIGVPLSSPDFGSLDSLLSMVEMPPGIPVGVTGKGKSGAKNAALLTVEILALSDTTLRDKLVAYREKMKKDLRERDDELQSRGWENYKK